MRPLCGIRHGGNRKERVPIFRETPFAFQNRNEPEKQHHTLYRKAIKKREIQEPQVLGWGLGTASPTYPSFSPKIGEEKMNLLVESLKALLFGIVEGITEWLPISSTGHMIMLDEFIQLQMSDAFKSMF